MLLLDIALDNYFRLCIERTDKSSLSGDDLLEMVGLVLRNACIAGESQDFGQVSCCTLCVCVCVHVCVACACACIGHSRLREFNKELIRNGLGCGHCCMTLQCWLLSFGWALAPRHSTPACVGLHTTGAIILNVCVKQDELVLMCLAYRHMGDEC